MFGEGGLPRSGPPSLAAARRSPHLGSYFVVGLGFLSRSPRLVQASFCFALNAGLGAERSMEEERELNHSVRVALWWTLRTLRLRPVLCGAAAWQVFRLVVRLGVCSIFQ